MLKFSTQVLTSSKDSNVRIINLDTDFLYLLEGKICSAIPLFEKGTTISELKTALGISDDAVLQKLINVFNAHTLLESTEASSLNSDCHGTFDLGELGELRIDVIETSDVVYAAKMINEFKT